MNDLRKYTTEELVELVKERKVSAGDLTDSGICPTCFDRSNNHVLWG